MRRFLFIVITMAALASCATAPDHPDTSGLSLDGIWTGTLHDEAFTDIYRLRLVIDGESVRSWSCGDDVWIEDDFDYRMSRVKENAVIYATYPVMEDGSTSVTTSAIIATPRSPTQLLVVSSWIENSSAMRMDSTIFRYNSHLAGILYRSSSLGAGCRV